MSTDRPDGAAVEPMTIERLGTRDPSWPAAVDIFDTTLRDGSQFEGIALTSDDKLKIAHQLGPMSASASPTPALTPP